MIDKLIQESKDFKKYDSKFQEKKNQASQYNTETFEKAQKEKKKMLLLTGPANPKK